MKSLPSLISISRVFFALTFYIILDFNPLPSIVPLLILFFLIELSDYLDGYFARVLNATSDLGKLLDPVCDITAHFLCLFALQKIFIVPSFVLVIFTLREIWVTFLRTILIHNNVVFAAKFSGKLKTALYALIIFFGIIFMPHTQFAGFAQQFGVYFMMLNYLAVGIAILSGLQYMYITWHVVSSSKK